MHSSLRHGNCLETVFDSTNWKTSQWEAFQLRMVLVNVDCMHLKEWNDEYGKNIGNEHKDMWAFPTHCTGICQIRISIESLV